VTRTAAYTLLVAAGALAASIVVAGGMVLCIVDLTSAVEGTLGP
jgi:hypothetical protein